MNSDEFNHSVIVGIIKTLEIMNKVLLKGDNLNQIDFNEIIELRKRVLVVPSVMDCLIEVSNENLK